MRLHPSNSFEHLIVEFLHWKPSLMLLATALPKLPQKPFLVVARLPLLTQLTGRTTSTATDDGP